MSVISSRIEGGKDCASWKDGFVIAVLLYPQTTQILTSGGRIHQWFCCFRSAFQNILLDHYPTVESRSLQMSDDGGEIDHALAERREDSVAHAVMEVQLALACFFELVSIDVLEVQAAQAVPMTLHQVHRIAAAIKVVSRIEAQAQGAVLDGGQQAFDLFRRFYVRSNVMMERDSQSELPAGTDHRRDTVFRRLPLGLGPGKPVRRIATSGDSTAFGGDGVGKHEQPRSQLRDEGRRGLDIRNAFFVPAAIPKMEFDKRRAHAELAFFQFFGKLLRLAGQVTIRSQLGAAVTCLRDLVQHPRVRIFRGHLDLFHDPPADWSTGD